MAQMESWIESLRDPPPPAFPSRSHIQPSTASSGPAPSAPSSTIRRKIILPQKTSPTATIETVIEVAWALLNVHYSNSDDVLYGLALVSGDIEDEQDVSGAEDNLRSLPKRFTYEPSQTTRECLEAVASRTEGLVSAMTSHKGSTEQPWESSEISAACDNQLVIFTDIMGLQNVEHDKALNVECTVGRQGLMVRAFYDPVIVDTPLAQRILGTFESMIHRLNDAENLDQPISNLEMISPEDVAQLSQWNGTLPPAEESCIHHLIAKQTEKHPDAEAICGHGVSLTYVQLDRYTNGLAHILIEKGVGPGTIVPFMFEKSVWAKVAMFATLKAGGAFNTLDPALQDDDVRGILETCGATVVLSSEKNIDRFASQNVEAIVITEDFLKKLPQHGPATSSVVPTDPAYAIFTSGSTGKPKGIVVSHQAFCTNAMAHGKLERCGTSTRTLQFSAYTFDMSISDIFTTLIFGGCVCVPTEAERLNGIAAASERMGANYTVITPTVARFLKPKKMPSLKILVTVGEPMTQDLVETWAHEVELGNTYGPAECATRVTFANKAPGDEGVTVGTALGSATWVTQSNNPALLAPIGGVGELLVEGPILANGYLRDEVKTNAAFIDKPQWLAKAFPSRASGKLYRTGDLVQYLSSGELRFVGRRDTQIKIHGVRLESGHIEAKIGSKLDEDDHVVVEKVAATGKTLLAAFLAIPRFTSAAGQEDELLLLDKTDEIQRFLSSLQQRLLEELPSYMVPNVLLPVSRIPLGGTGKINRRALQALIKDIPEEQLTIYTAARDGDVSDPQRPQGQTEKTVASLWASVCAVPATSISRDDTFFGLGGDSVSAMKLVSLAEAESGINFSVADVFQHAGLAQFAEFLDSNKGAGTDSAAADLAPLEPFSLIGGAATLASLGRYLATEYKIATRRVEDIIPCAPLQSGMMAETIASPEPYILQEVLIIDPSVDLAKFQQACEDVVMRSPILRTRIMSLPQLGSCQVILSADEPFEWLQDTDVLAYVSKDKSNHMGYGDPLTRFAIIHEDDGTRYLVWTCHHAITDARSNQNLVDQVAQTYFGNEPRAGIDFSHFVQYLSKKDIDASRRYWRAQFDGIGVAKFPPVDDDSYEPVATDHVIRHMQLPSASATGTTSAILLRAAWAIVLAELTASSDVVLGITQHGRDVPLPGIDRCLGPVLATVPVAIRLEESMSFAQFLGSVQQQYIDMIPYQHDGLQNIRKASPEAASACDFNSLLVVQAAASPSNSEKLVVATDKGRLGEQLGFGLVLECFLGTDSTTRIRADFDHEVISAPQVELLVHRLEHIVSQLGDPSSKNLPLSALNMTSSYDLEALNSFNPDVPAMEKCMHWLIEEQAQQQPDALAVDSWDGQLTYRQLLDQSDRLAGRLVEFGVGPEVIVPFAFEKSVWAVVAIQAILRAGGVCVAIDMAHPRSRHEKIVADAEAKVIVTSATNATALTGLVPHLAISSASAIEALPRRKPNDRGSAVMPSNAAFIVYSSGSTGQPKGSILEHRSLCTTSRTNTDILSVGPQTRAIAFSSHSFDVCIEENVIITMYGGTIVIPSDQERIDDLPGVMRRMNVNWADLTPTVGRLLTPQNVPALRTLVLGGEALTQDIINTWAGKVGMFNTYGPSECSIQCTSSRSLEQAAAGSNIGRASNCKLWVVNSEDPNRLLPPGCVGELLIEGPIVGRGYLKEPTKTKAVFLTDLAWATSANGSNAETSTTPRRFYRTGDLFRYNLDGTLDCLGRRDNQIKLHGQRIELGEIEYNIKKASSRPDETMSVVEAFSPKNAETKLLAAFIQAENAKASGSEMVLSTLSDSVRAELESVKLKVSQVLPEYMVPSYFIPVAGLPMNTSGKIDRKKLRESASNLDQSQLGLYSLGHSHSSRRVLGTEREKRLAALWTEVLHIDESMDPIGADDGFVERGGDSIAAMQLVGKAKAKGLILSVTSVMKSASLADMAASARFTMKEKIEAPSQPQSLTQPESVVESNKPASEPAPEPVPELVPEPTAPVKSTPYTPFSLLPSEVAVNDALADLQNIFDIPRDLIEDVYPCTPLQAGLMAITACDFAAGSTSYVLREVYTLPPGTDIETFKAAWAAVVRKTPILRTRIAFVDGIGSCQVVLDERPPWTVAKSVEECFEVTKAQPMGYGQPLSRWALVTEPSGETKFVWSIHHSLYDGFSHGLVLSAVNHAYNNRMAVPDASPYVDFIRYISSIDKDAEERYWAKTLEGTQPRPFPPVPNGKQCVADNKVDYRSSVTVRRPGTPTATILKAAWAIVTSRLSDAEEVVFGVTQFGRDVDVPGVETMVGPTITTVPVRVQVDPQASVDALLGDITKQGVEMTPYSHTGLQNIKRVSDAANDACNFQSLLVIQTETEEEDSDFVFRLHEPATNADFLRGFGLAIECAMGDGSMTLTAHHDTSVISAAQVQRFLKQFETVVVELCASSSAVKDVNMVSSTDRENILAWNKAQQLTEVDRCAHEIIAEQTRKNPTAMAIETREASITYEQLDELTTDLANRLQAHGVGPESLVPVCLEKSANGIIAMVGIQKAGAAFVSINPSDPAERLRGLVEQVDARVVIFSEHTAHLNPTVANGRSTITMPSSLSSWRSPLNTEPISSLVKPDNLAYALFTSGSTGKPKAVELSHRTLSSSVTGHATAMGYLPGRGQRVLQFISYTFDPCIIEIFTTLTHGGCICVPSESERLNNLTQFVKDFRCDYAIFTPSFARGLNPQDFPTLKTLVLGGEAMTQDLAEMWGDRLQLINAYGPTETAIVCTSRTVRGPKTATEEDRQLVPESIGRPVNSFNWVINPTDPDLLVPVGCTGELAVTGPILARGYLDEPEKTADAFVQGARWMDDFGIPRQKLYRTGDLVKQDPANGTYTYINRKDHQTKVNGQRLELGEIESQLKTQGRNVKLATVVAGKTKLDSKRQTLAAFIEFEDSVQSTSTVMPMTDRLKTDLRSLEDTLRMRLPRYMVPTIWVPMSKMPVLAASGKIDRKALVALFAEFDEDQLSTYGLAESGDRSDSDTQATSTEKKIIGLVARHLGRDAGTISPGDSFVRLGGDSIAAIQLISAARSEGLVLSTEDILRQPLISDMARNAQPVAAEGKMAKVVTEPFSMIEGKKQDVFDSIAEDYSISSTAISDIHPCTPLQQGLITLTVQDPNAYVLREVYRLSSKLDLDRFKASWEAVLQDACVLRSRIVNLEGLGCFQVVVNEPIEWRSAKSVKEYIEADNASPFKYGVPLCKFGLVETPYNGTFFIFTMHHSIYDGWSKGMIYTKVEEAYNASTPQPTVAPTPPFRDFVRHLQSIGEDESKSFWKNQFKGLEAQAFPRAPAADFNAVLDKEVSLDIHLDRKPGSAFTTSTLLKAAWAIILGRYTGSPEALFGVVQTGRHAPVDGISDIIGPTLTTVPLRIRLDTQATMVDFLHAIQDQTTQLIRYEHYGLQNIARIDQDCRDACNFANIMVIQPGTQPDGDFFAGTQVQNQDKAFLSFAMGLECTLQEDCVQVTGAYDHRIVDESQMERMLNQLAATVQQINLETQTSILDIDLFSPEDWEEMTEMNAAVPSDVRDVTHEVIHRTALDASTNIAVNAWDIDLMYSELDQLSSVLAHHLQSLGVGPETIVPLCFEKSGWAVVALLGVIKAGGAFVFADPSYPIARLKEIVGQVEAKVILSSLSTSSLWENSGMHVQVVDNVAIESLPSTTGMPKTKVTPNNALYVIFTSGSTGKPKGCVIEHHSFLTCAGAQASRSSINPDSRVLQGASYSFDVSVMEMLTALTVGACICIPSEAAKSKSVSKVINDFRISWAFLTPSVAKFINPKDVPTLKTLVLGGEALTTQSVQTWADGVQLINGYGPSECTIAASANSQLSTDTDPANIGKALGGTCWIVDPEDHDKLAPLGTIGELLIEGPIVARGYLNNPEKTAEVFVENPAWGEREPGTTRRLYKTGDLAYFSADGDIMFVGRKDSQVKVRGQRVELGEIETHLSLSKEIQHALVMYPKVGLCKGKLVGLISLKDFGATTNTTGAVELLGSKEVEKASGDMGEVTSRLASIVPGYMVPNIWVVVSSFPLLVSGKLNRKRVEQWLNNIDEATHHQICGIGKETQTKAPQSALESELRNIWADVLKLPATDIGTTQDFTALGGDSILAMVVISKLRKKGSNISMGDLVKARTISQLALLVQQRTSADPFWKEAEVEEVTDEVFDLTPMQQYYANFTLKKSNYLSKQTNKRFNYMFCLRVKKPIAGDVLSEALEALVERHSMLRARFIRDENAPCGWRQYVPAYKAEQFYFRSWDNYTLDEIKPTLENTRLSLDVENGPILAGDLVSVNENEQYFYVVAHHLVVDLVSWNSILRDLEDMLEHGEFMTDKPYPFSAWAQAQREFAQKKLTPEDAYPLKVPSADFAYWGMKDRLNIMRDVTSHEIILSKADTTALTQACSKHYAAEPLDVLCSSLWHSFHLTFRDRNTPTIYRWGNGREGEAISDAGPLDVSSTVGWFSTLVPLHVRVSDKDDSLTLLHRTIETRKRIPANGFHYFASRYHNDAGLDPAGPFAGHEDMEVTINYLGSSDGQDRSSMRYFEMPKNMEGTLGGQDKEVKVFSLFYINAEIKEGRMHLNCEWNAKAEGQERIQNWFKGYEKCLVDVARRAAAGQVPRRRVVPASMAKKKYRLI